MSDKKQRPEYKGYKKIYTDVAKITEQNVIDVLTDALITHEQNRARIDFLINYDRGFQPLQREKKIRKDINVQCISNLAHMAVEWNEGYFWGNHMAFVQKSDKNPKGSDPAADDSAISLFNAMWEAADMESKDQVLANFVEIVGLCPQLVDYKRKYNPDVDDTCFDLVTLSPRYAFVVYSSDAYEREIMGVSYSEDSEGNRNFSCITEKQVFLIRNTTEIVNGVKRDVFKPMKGSGERNPFGMINLIECPRSVDLTGCFEHAIDQMDALNILESEAVNSVSQGVQAIWFVTDLDFDTDEDGNLIAPVDGQWVLAKTNSNGGQKPDIKPLVMPLDYNGVLSDIDSKREEILQNLFIPVQKDQSGGSTTGATSLSSGWASAEAVACKKAQLVKSFYRKRNALALKAISLVKGAPEELRTLKNSDIDIRPIRQKTFDMATKVNALATMVNTMIHPRHAMEAIDFFPNLAETVEDSIDMMLKYQEHLVDGGSQAEASMEQILPDNPDDMLTVDGQTDRIMADSSDQAAQSPVSDL